MFKKLFLVIGIMAFFISGCPEEKASSQKAPDKRPDNTSAILDYLRSQKLPAVESLKLWENQYGSGIEIITAHYRIYTTLLEPLMLTQVPGFVEAAYHGYSSLLSTPLDTTDAKFTIYLFSDRKQWDAFTKPFTGDDWPVYSKIRAGAYYLNGSVVAYNIGRERTFSVLGHEGWHQFNSRHFKYRLPSCFDEGISMLFEVTKYENSKFYFEPGKNILRLAALKKALINNKTLHLKDLVSINPGEVISSGDGDAVNTFYAQAYALMRFLQEDQYGKYLLKFRALLDGGLNGSWPLNDQQRKLAEDRNIRMTVQWNRTLGQMLFKHYISDDFELLEKEYILFCKKIVYPVRLQ